MPGRARALAAGLAAAAALAAPAAHAHGPCSCSEPKAGAPGTAVRSEHPIERVVFNPRRADLPIGPEFLAADLAAGAPRLELLRRPRARRGATFRLPYVPSGRYLVVFYDGEEGGAHYGWDHVEVRAAPFRYAAGATGSGGSPLLFAALGLGLGLLAGTVRRQRRLRGRLR